MCYSNSRFENYMGDCRVRDFKKFEIEMHIPPCIACQGYDFDTKEELASGRMKEHEVLEEEDLFAIARDTMDKNLLF